MQRSAIVNSKSYTLAKISIYCDIPERRKVKLTLLSTIPVVDIFQRFLSVSKLKRGLAYCLRFIRNIRTHQRNKITGVLTPNELEESSSKFIKMVRQNLFHDLINYRVVSHKSKLLCLNPFLDENKIIWVGGGLTKYFMNSDRKFLTVLPEKHSFTELSTREEHQRLFHTGPKSYYRIFGCAIGP